MIRMLMLSLCTQTLLLAADPPQQNTTPTPVGPESSRPNDWMLPILLAVKPVISSKPEIATVAINKQSARLNMRVAESAWNPSVSFSPDFSESRSESNSVIDGPGIIKSQSGSTSLGLSKNFATGTSVGLSGSSSASRSDGAGVISDDFYSSAIGLSISQNLLRGGNRTVNLSGILAAQDAERDARDGYEAALESQYSDVITRWMNLALSQVSIEQLKRDVDVAKENLRQFEERFKIGLIPELEVQSLRRGVADREVQLAKAVRAYAADQRQMDLYWPQLQLPDRKEVLTDILPTLPATISFAHTRLGQSTLRDLASAARNVNVSRDGALDDLSLNGSISKSGSDGDLGGSWHQLDNRNVFNWGLSLSYSHTFGTEANRIGYQQALLTLEQAHLNARMAERDWHAQSLSLRDAFNDALEGVKEQERLVTVERNELALTAAQVEAARATTRDLVDAQQRVSNAVLDLYRANLDVFRADLALRLHENRLLSLVP
jgi:outer membrane protein TolC